ncbi:hypothetical protein NDN08_006130 [Rhodosorus marinus]|uniref:Uncharacterized protein n=1 Tax=Rhodosorus marinus TaxID=101924 RepID=A0AAV8UJT6_9RHOD|nr:hypothetical protein NDN08_006130 [Rhodosorus marinus]
MEGDSFASRSLQRKIDGLPVEVERSREGTTEVTDWSRTSRSQKGPGPPITDSFGEVSRDAADKRRFSLRSSLRPDPALDERYKALIDENASASGSGGGHGAVDSKEKDSEITLSQDLTSHIQGSSGRVERTEIDPTWSPPTHSGGNYERKQNALKRDCLINLISSAPLQPPEWKGLPQFSSSDSQSVELRDSNLSLSLDGSSSHEPPENQEAKQQGRWSTVRQRLASLKPRRRRSSSN